MTPLSADELQQLEDTLTRFSTDDSILEASELDGYLTAVLSTPDSVSEEQWLLDIWGGGETPKWDSEADEAAFVALVKQHKDHLEAQFSSDNKELILLFNIDDSGEEEVLDVSDWCFGYIRGANIDAPYWTGLPELESQILANVYLFGSPDFEEELNKLDAAQVGEVRNTIPSVAVHLFKYAQTQK